LGPRKILDRPRKQRCEEQVRGQLKEDVEWRKEVAEKTGLGFALRASSEISIEQLGQPEMIRSEEEKTA
jgi:hypothetical protein